MSGIQSTENRQSQMNTLHNTRYDTVCAQELRLSEHTDVVDVANMWEKGTYVISIGLDRADGVGIFFKSKVEIIKRGKPDVYVF